VGLEERVKSEVLSHLGDGTVPTGFQWEGVEFLLQQKKAILADETGTGKTGQGYMTWLAAGRPGPLLIIARSNAQSSWQIQSSMWGVQFPYSISGTAKRREGEWADVDWYSVVTTTFDTIKADWNKGWLPKKWGFIIFDEYHRYILSRKTQSYKYMKELARQSDYVLLLTGSPMRRGFEDLWAPLNILDHRSFSSYWKFVQAFGFVQRNEMGAWEILGLKEKDLLAQRIRPFYLRREKKDVLQQLPESRRDLTHLLTMTPKQQKMYDQLSEELLAEMSDGSVLMTPTQLTKITRLRQILCTPLLLDEGIGEWGAALDHLGEMTEDTDDHHFVVFTPFAQAIPHIYRYLAFENDATKLNRPIISLRGGLSPQEVTERIKLFKEEEGIAICSIQYSESFDLVPAKWAYFCGFSWDVWVDNLQAEARLHRLTTKSAVTYYYPQHRGGVDQELMMPILNQKASETMRVHNSVRNLRAALISAKQQSSTND